MKKIGPTILRLEIATHTPAFLSCRGVLLEKIIIRKVHSKKNYRKVRSDFLNTLYKCANINDSSKQLFQAKEVVLPAFLKFSAINHSFQ